MREVDHGPGVKLVPSSARRRWLRSTRVWLVVVVVLLAGFAVQQASGLGEQQSCASAVRTGPVPEAVDICLREYLGTWNAETGVRLANAMLEDGRLDAALAIASWLPASVRSDATSLLGKIARKRNQLGEATSLFQRARAMHALESRPLDVARDDHALAGLYDSQERFTEALTILDECIASARAGVDQLLESQMLESYCRMAAGSVLSRVGQFEMARKELDRAQELATSERNLAMLALERGNLEQELARSPAHVGRDELAIDAFEHVLAYAIQAGMAERRLIVELNLVHSLAEVRRFDDAARHLAAARQLDGKREKQVEATWLEARLAYHRGELARAWSLNEGVYPSVEAEEDRLDIAVLQARIALQRDELDLAEDWAQRGIDDAEAMRAAQPVELRPWVLSTYREPYELRFVALARGGRAEEALLAFDQWQARWLRDALARPMPPADLRSVARSLAGLDSWLPAVTSAPSANSDAVLATLRTVDLLALAVADGDVWTIWARRGEISIRRLDALANLDVRLKWLRTHPTEHAIADELGELILRDDVMDRPGEVLHVLLDGRLAALPVVALRHGGRPLVAIRPVLRVSRLPEARCVPVARGGRASVLADATGDLPAARQEAIEVAAMLGATSALGAAATSEALFSTAGDATLHVGVHSGLDVSGGALELHDRRVSALEIAARKRAASLVVLSSCISAASRDDELAGSLATAFLAAGAAQVVATLRPVDDAGARNVVSAFYRDGGAADPVRALARVQARLAATSSTHWPEFAVFGHDVCRAEP